MSIQKFLDEHADLADTYEVWGSIERPENPITMGELRRIPEVTITEELGEPTTCIVRISGVTRFIGSSFTGRLVSEPSDVTILMLAAQIVRQNPDYIGALGFDDGGEFTAKTLEELAEVLQ